MNKADAQSLYHKVLLNSEKLRGCKAHSFGDVLGQTTGPLENKFTCQKCGGYMRSHDIWVYAKGYLAAGGNPDEVARFCDGESVA